MSDSTVSKPGFVFTIAESVNLMERAAVLEGNVYEKCGSGNANASYLDVGDSDNPMFRFVVQEGESFPCAFAKGKFNTNAMELDEAKARQREAIQKFFIKS